jgi:hypothetical protein
MGSYPRSQAVTRGLKMELGALRSIAEGSHPFGHSLSSLTSKLLRVCPGCPLRERISTFTKRGTSHGDAP